MRLNTVFGRGAIGFLVRKGVAAKNIITREFYRVCSQSDFTWRYIANLRSTLEYRRIRMPLSDAHERLLADLKRDGIVKTSVEDLMGRTCFFGELETAVWKHDASLADEVNRARENMNLPGQVKSYLVKLLGPRPTLDHWSVRNLA